MSDISQQLQEQIKAAIDTKQTVIIQGNDTKHFLGRSVDEDANIISTAEHTGIISYEPVELVMTARAGTTLAEIDAALAENNQVLACDPARFEGRATIGGSLATNQAGPSRPWEGSLRDHVLGVNMINGRAQALRFGGQVMKNVAGYDVSRLQAGAMGTLGLITEVSFKVLPASATTLTLVGSASISQAIHTMNELSAKPKPLTAATWVDGKIYLQLSGARSAVEGTADKWSGDVMPIDQATLFWQDLREQRLSFFSQRKEAEPLWRFSVNSSAPAFLEEAPWLIDWAGSQRWLKGDFPRTQLQQWATENGGELVLYRGGDRSSDIFHQPNSVIKKYQKNLKQTFDPNNIFNIGRLYSWM